MPALTISYYDPAASRMRADTLEDFLRAPLSGDLEEVPGVGKDTKLKLHAHGIMTTHQLIGVYLREGSVNAFYSWLQGVGVNAHRNTVVTCISHKTTTFMGPTVCTTHPPPTPVLPSVAEETTESPAVPVNNKNKAKNARKRAQKKAKKIAQRA